MQKELLNGNVFAPNSALLYDRIKVNSNEPQLLGSQVKRDPETNKFKPYLIIKKKYYYQQNK